MENKWKLDGVRMAQKNYEEAIAIDNAIAYSRKCKIKKAKETVVDFIGTGCFITFLVVLATFLG